MTARSFAALLPAAVRFVCGLALLLAPWPGLGDAYSDAATIMGNACLVPLELKRVDMLFVARVAERGPASEPTGFTTVLRVRERASGQALQIPIELRTLAYIPTAAFLALSIACGSRRRLGRTALQLLIGLCVLQLFLCASLAVPILLFFASPAPMQLLTLSEPVFLVLTVFYRSLVAPPGMIYAVPLFLWLFLRNEAAGDTIVSAR